MRWMLPCKCWVENSMTADSISTVESLVCLGIPTKGETLQRIEDFVRRGGQLVWFPSSEIVQQPIVPEITWSMWSEGATKQASFDDLEFAVERYAGIQGDVVKVAQTADGEVLIGKRRLGKGTIWFCGCDVIHARGRFVSDGVVLYGLLSEALSGGGVSSEEVERVVGRIAGQVTNRIEIDRLAEPVEGFSIRGGDSRFNAGVYRLNVPDGDARLIAVNPPASEFDAGELSIDRLRQLIGQHTLVEFRVESDPSASGPSMVQELWGGIWVVVLVVMISEAWASLPPGRRSDAA